MITKLVTTAGTLCLGALILSACVSQSQYDAAAAENQRLKAQLAALQAEQKYVEAADYLFPSGGFQLSPAGQAELANNIVPKLKGLQNAKIVVYGYTDNVPVGPSCSARAFPTIWCCRRAGLLRSPIFSWRKGSIPTSFRPKGSAIRDRSPRTIRHKAGHRIAGSRSPFRVRAPDHKVRAKAQEMTRTATARRTRRGSKKLKGNAG